jgi:hypothetical protein
LHRRCPAHPSSSHNGHHKHHQHRPGHLLPPCRYSRKCYYPPPGGPRSVRSSACWWTRPPTKIHEVYQVNREEAQVLSSSLSYSDVTATDTQNSSMGTQIFLITGLFTLMIAYATQSSIVALQSRLNSPFYITSAYSYPQYTAPFGNNDSIKYGKIISILSFLYQCAMIIMNACIVGAIWIHANHVQNNGTGIKEPGFLSWIWNGFWILAILALGFASWAVGLARRGSGNSALAYPSLIRSDYLVRTLYVTYVAVVIAASTSATLEAVLCWLGIRKNGVTGVSLPLLCT